MKTALYASAFALFATVASAENPNLGMPADLQPLPQAYETQASANSSSYGAPQVSVEKLQGGTFNLGAGSERPVWSGNR